MIFLPQETNQSESRTKVVNWLFGRGLSIDCNLTWQVPEKWKNYDREKKIKLINEALLLEMDESYVDCKVITNLINKLSKQPTKNLCHRFITTNWDYLLQREISKLNLVRKPVWLKSSHVYHLNGTIENIPVKTNRSPFLLEEDLYSQRVSTIEAEKVYNEIVWGLLFVIVGMSFECETDKFLLQSIQKIEDYLPIGISTWIIINPCDDALNQSCQNIQHHLPRATLIPIKNTLSDWIDHGMPDLFKKCL